MKYGDAKRRKRTNRKNTIRVWRHFRRHAIKELPESTSYIYNSIKTFKDNQYFLDLILHINTEYNKKADTSSILIKLW